MNASSKKDEMSKYGAGGIPSLVLVDSRGNKLENLTVSQNPMSMVKILQDAYAKYGR